MTAWQYARVTIVYQGERTEIRESWFGLRVTEFQVHDWIVECQVHGQSSVEEVTGTDAMDVEILNTWGQDGWEVVTASESENRFEYLLKRWKSGDSYEDE